MNTTKCDFAYLVKKSGKKHACLVRKQLCEGPPVPKVTNITYRRLVKRWGKAHADLVRMQYIES